MQMALMHLPPSCLVRSTPSTRMRIAICLNLLIGRSAGLHPQDVMSAACGRHQACCKMNFPDVLD